MTDDGPCNAFQSSPDRRGKKSDETSELAELTVPEVRRLLEVALPLHTGSAALRLAWSAWRRAKRLLARRSHFLHRYQPSPSPRSYSNTS
jgi:hypothetical protein